eukprot:gnl/MRDRNA2_/MRDRNA2_132349_c0_seq1.p1 gnl/MRDRNA2_/MRDRNA2_132349_c0~~gnl/MRDRNA2_/MRDRNA2_132349_c0_seq1.p1  ORF type:complete len:529 (-),score=62.40 gnl/MRDRNA2_/MRDRNA2_132349_c0_seq1:209-1795(-)
MGIAFVLAVITVTLKWYQLDYASQIPDGVFPDSFESYTSLSWMLGFVLVIRTNQAYNRFWEGAMNLHQMTGEWYDACAQITAFVETSKSSRERIDAFQLTMVRLFSLLHGVALHQIAENKDENIEFIDPHGLDAEHLEYLHWHTKKTHPDIVVQWIARTISEAVNSGLVDTPPPIVSRVFNECNSGLIALGQMRKTAELVFPVPYSKMVWVLLCTHLFITPFYAVSFTNARFWAGIYSFIAVFSLWSIQYIAIELEQPFGDGADDLDLAYSQNEMNESLIHLLDRRTQWAPDLNEVIARDQIALYDFGTPQFHLSRHKGTLNMIVASLGEKAQPGLHLPKKIESPLLPAHEGQRSEENESFRVCRDEVDRKQRNELEFKVGESSKVRLPSDDEKERGAEHEGRAIIQMELERGRKPCGAEDVNIPIEMDGSTRESRDTANPHQAMLQTPNVLKVKSPRSLTPHRLVLHQELLKCNTQLLQSAGTYWHTLSNSMPEHARVCQTSSASQASAEKPTTDYRSRTQGMQMAQ